MATLTIPQIVEVAQVSQYLAANNIVRQGLIGAQTNTKLPRHLYMVRKNVSWLYALDTADTGLPSVSNYLLGLCGQFQFQALAIINLGVGGTIVSAGNVNQASIGYLRITSSDFANSTDYVNANLDGIQFRLFGNWIARYLEPSEYQVLSGGGFRILIAGFNSTTFDYEIYLDSKGSLSGSGSTPGTGFAYSLSATTLIPNITAGDPYAEATVTVTPNGFSYTWDTNFVFTFNFPEQPLATTAGTVQIYQFQYIASIGKWICVGQSLDVPL